MTTETRLPVSATASPRSKWHPPAGLVDVHLIWEREIAKLAAIDLAAADEPTRLAVRQRMGHLERLILTTPARTLDGVTVQARCVAASKAQADGGERKPRGSSRSRRAGDAPPAASREAAAGKPRSPR